MALESMEETADKIRAMAAEKLDRRFLVIGRPGTYVARVHPDEESRRRDWIRRAKVYQEAGADVIFAICWTVEHAKFFRTQVTGPMMTIRTLGTEYFNYDENRHALVGSPKSNSRLNKNGEKVLVPRPRGAADRSRPQPGLRSAQRGWGHVGWNSSKN